MRRTKALVKVGTVFLESPDARHYGYELRRAARVRSGVLYPLLRRLLEAGWLSDDWEDPKAIVENRPPRRFYVLTSEGRDLLQALVVAARTEN